MAKVKNKDGKFRRIWYGIWRWISVTAVRGYCRMRVYGIENVPLTGPVLVLSNHQSFFDPMFCQSWVRRPFYFVARDTLFTGFWGAVIDSFYTIPIKQEQADIAAMKAIIEVLNRGYAVCLYPEGSRTADGTIETIKPGFSLLTRRTGACVVPMVIDGAFECWPRTQKYPKPGGVGILYGKPISADYIKQVGDQRFIDELNRILRQMQNDLRQKMGRPPVAYPNLQEHSA
ncbi:MAG: 1-acyl-sn-glycerol-3-phosphate acyltransferase [Planctomycetales bacterium]|nr:1-acyl-sn-glycerol-3-phosphate acyltransferase [Planctomycetales bacterium]